jgi:hypothetical protein
MTGAIPIALIGRILEQRLRELNLCDKSNIAS